MPHEIKQSKGQQPKGQQPKRREVDLSESSVYGDESAEPSTESSDDVATQSTIDRLEEITGRAGDERELENPNLYQGRLGLNVEKLDASTDEEIDALELDLLQDDARADARDGSGRIVDDVAEERLAEYTEVGPDLDDEGALSVAPGNEDTSATLRRHQTNTDTNRGDAIIEANVDARDEPRDETLSECEVDEEPGV